MKRLFAMIAILCSWAATAYAVPVILNASVDVKPSDVICLQGSDFGASPTVWCSSNHGAYVQLSVFGSGNGVVQAQLPQVTYAVYSVYVKNGTVASSAVYLNLANPMHFDTPEVAADGTFRIFGRNLGWSSQTAVQFVSGSTILPATVTAYSENTLTVTAPASLVAGTMYTVKVWNGLGNSTSDYVACPILMKGRSGSSDPFSLGVLWGANYSTIAANVYNVKTDSRLSSHAYGDGTHDDRAAIQNAIAVASAAGGGTVYLPAGTYKLLCQGVTGSQPSGFLLSLQNNVVIKGAGQGSTTITYGYESNPAPTPYTYFALLLGGISNVGFCDLTVQNLNTGGGWSGTGSIATSFPSGGVECVGGFLARVTYDIKTSQNIFFEGDHQVVTGCTLGAAATVAYLGGSTNFRFSGNTVSQTSGSNANFDSCSAGVVESNLFQLNANGGLTDSSVVRHGVTLNFAQNVAVVNNQLTVFNGVPGANNDGEAIISEGGGPNRPGEEFGHVTSASGTTVNVGNSASYLSGTVLSIISGTGRGQWRTISSRSGTAVTVSSAWAVPPDSTSNYAVFLWGLRNVLINGNTITNWPGGAVVAYMCSTTDTQISQNTITGMDGIWIQPDQCNTSTQASPNGRFNPVWNTQVEANTLASRGTHGTYINLTADLQYSGDNRLYGTMALNCEVRRNTLTGSEVVGSQTQTLPSLFYNYQPETEGYVNYLRSETTTTDDQGIPALLGTVFMWNTAADCAERAFLINGGAYQTFICATNTWNDFAFLTDSTQYGAWPGRAAKDATHDNGTVNIANGWVAPTVFECENGTLIKGNPSSPLSVYTGVAQASNHASVGGMNYTGDAVSIGGVPGDGAAHQITVRYACPVPSYSSIYLNGTKIGTISWPITQDWNTYSDATISVTLPSGSNTIKIQRDAADNSVNLDKLVLN